jgi:hypothetical protein
VRWKTWRRQSCRKKLHTSWPGLTSDERASYLAGHNKGAELDGVLGERRHGGRAVVQCWRAEAVGWRGAKLWTMEEDEAGEAAAVVPGVRLGSRGFGAGGSAAAGGEAPRARSGSGGRRVTRTAQRQQRVRRFCKFIRVSRGMRRWGLLALEGDCCAMLSKHHV